MGVHLHSGHSTSSTTDHLKSIMKVFYFMFCLALVSGLGFDTEDVEDLKDFLTKDIKGRQFGCSEKKFTVNKKKFTLLYNEAQCSEDMLGGENVLRQKTDGSIVNNNDEPVVARGIIDEEIFNLIFPGFEQKKDEVTTTPTTPTTSTTPTSSTSSQTSSGNYAGLSYFI